MIIFKKRIRVYPKDGHQLIDIKGRLSGYLDDVTCSVVEISPLSTSFIYDLRYVAEALGYTFKSYNTASYDEKKRLKRLYKEFS